MRYQTPYSESAQLSARFFLQLGSGSSGCEHFIDCPCTRPKISLDYFHESCSIIPYSFFFFQTEIDDPYESDDSDDSDNNSYSEEKAREKVLMDWMYVAPEDSGVAVGLPQLGFHVGDRYKVATNATCTLHAISARLASEDKALRIFRRQLGFSQIVHKDLAPILMECNTPDSFEVFAAAIR